MNKNMFGGRAVRAALIALTVAAVAAPSAAEAGKRTRTAIGVGVAAGALGLALGAAAANQDREVVYEERRRPRCWTERQEYEDRWGDIRVRRIRVCE